MKNALILCALFLVAQQARPQVCGPNSAVSFSTTTISGSNANWSDVEYTDASDDKYASFGNIPGGIGSFTDYMVITNFGFNIPQGTIIHGIVVSIERSDPAGLTADYSIRIVKGGTIGATERSTGAAYPLTDADQTYGSTTDLWGESWSYKEITNADFGVAIAAKRNSIMGTTQGQVDNVRITVYFSYMVLPLNIESFTATKGNKQVMLNWKTSAEMNIDRFIVERSADGRSFSTLTSVAATNLAGANYSYCDNSPLAGRSFYRLRVTEHGTSDKYSQVATISFDKTSLAGLFPSPWSPGKDLFVDNPVREELTIRFFNNAGILLAKSVTSNNKVVMPAGIMTSEMVYYKVYDRESHLKGSGRLVID
jgi:hypothetical protein